MLRLCESCKQGNRESIETCEHPIGIAESGLKVFVKAKVLGSKLGVGFDSKKLALGSMQKASRS